MKPIIKVENLSKFYKLGARQNRPSTLVESIVETIRSPFQARKFQAENDTNGFWALKDVNFEIMPGEVVGIIGRNGAGKSTLLKILSRITKPTTGNIKLYGRIESLLEVGTGFHPELTGRENIFLNGAILGMRREEIAKKFDEIVDFAGVEKFLDTPVKRYSSGMYVRLAFAVAAHLEPEIMVIDEVLAVGDAEFQKKCLGKMDEVSKTGRTIIFVSHQLGSVAQLCRKSILLEKGAVTMIGETSRVIQRYLNQGSAQATYYAPESDRAEREMYFQNAAVLNASDFEQNTFRHDDEIHVSVKCGVQKRVAYSELRMIVKDSRGILVFTADAELDGLSNNTREFEVVYTIPANFLRPNKYSLTFSIFVPHQRHVETIEEVLSFSVFDGGSKYAQSEGFDYGTVFSPCEYSVRKIR